MTALDSSGMMRGMAQSRINEISEFTRSKSNKWVYEDLAHVLFWADVNESTLEDQIVNESWSINLSAPTPTINLSGVTISTDLGSTAGDYFDAATETGFSGKEFAFENLQITTTLTADGESANLDFQVGSSLIFTFDSEWYNDSNSHLQRGGMTTTFFIFLRITNQGD
jgi:hypothetical protein